MGVVTNNDLRHVAQLVHANYNNPLSVMHKNVVHFSSTADAAYG